MNLVFRLLLVTSLAAGALAAEPQRGHLMLIGGGEKPRAAMQKFVELAGGKDAPIVVIPTASRAPDTPEYYEKLFRDEYGSTDVVVLPIRSKADASRPELVAAAKRARGIFFGGGDQVRILVALAGTPVLDALREAFRNGAVVGGTSAGTACQSDLMLTGEGNFKVIQSRSVELWDGLGFLRDDVIVDQHFIARQRQNRLLSVVLEHPRHLGIGVDEDTAIWVRPDDTFEVIGEGSVMVFDAAGSDIRRAPRPDGKELLGVRGMRMHIVLPGEAFDLAARMPVGAAATAAGAAH
ncbi:MAG TPA: cyanophycinase [Thermoanaerobaculia bacterium]|nr:cyanophycinase [Thermoanaerobaculia bacterium]